LEAKIQITIQLPNLLVLSDSSILVRYSVHKIKNYFVKHPHQVMFWMKCKFVDKVCYLFRCNGKARASA